jgi:hypothetical protein
MKFFSLPSSIALTSLLWTVSNATIKINDLPLQLGAGATYSVTWSNDRDYVSCTWPWLASSPTT